MRRPSAAALAAAAAVLAGCGTPSPDLFVVDRSGTIPGARLRLLVSDGGTVRCNGGGERPMPDAILLAARELARDLKADAEMHLALPAGRRSVLAYSIRLEHGTVRFSDSSPAQPPELRRAALLTRRLARGVCGLAR